MSNGKPSDLAQLSGGRATGIYWCPPITTGPLEGRRGALLLVASPGPKPFIRVWLDDITATDTGRPADRTWHKPDDAVRVV